MATRPDGTTVTRYCFGSPSRGLEGATTEMAMHAGTGVDDVTDAPPAATVIERLWAEYLAAAPPQRN